MGSASRSGKKSLVLTFDPLSDMSFSAPVHMDIVYRSELTEAGARGIFEG